MQEETVTNDTAQRKHKTKQKMQLRLTLNEVYILLMQSNKVIRLITCFAQIKSMDKNQDVIRRQQ